MGSRKKTCLFSSSILYGRENQMIYRGQDSLAVVWFGSSTTPSPLSRKQILCLSQSSSVSPGELSDGSVGGKGRERSQIIGRRESLVLYKSFITLCFTRKNWAEILEQSMGARNRVGIGLSYRPARLHRLEESILLWLLKFTKFGFRLHRLADWIPWNRFLGSLKVLKHRLCIDVLGARAGEAGVSPDPRPTAGNLSPSRLLSGQGAKLNLNLLKP